MNQLEFLKDAPVPCGYVATGEGEKTLRAFLPIGDIPMGCPLTFYMWDSPAGREAALFYRNSDNKKRRRDYMIENNLPVQYGGDHDATKAIEDSNG